MSRLIKSNAPLLVEGQTQAEIYHNQALIYLNALTNLVLASITPNNTPPGSPGDETCWLTGSAATGVWADQDDKIAIYKSAAWYFITPTEGLQAYALDTTLVHSFNGSAWTGGPVDLGDITGTVTLDETLGSDFYARLTGNITLNGPAGGSDGQRIRIRLKQDGTGSRSVTGGTRLRTASGYSFPAGTANKATRYELVYYAADSKWELFPLHTGEY